MNVGHMQGNQGRKIRREVRKNPERPDFTQAMGGMENF